MAKTKWSEVTNAAEDRRDRATPENNPYFSKSGARAFHLPEMVASSSIHKIMAKKSTEATLAIGWAINPANASHVLLYAVCKGVALQDVGPALRVLAYNCGGASIIALTTDSGVHSEMQIVRSYCNSCNIQKPQMKNFGLQIACIGKPVCKDCGGFLNKYGIPNISILPPGKIAEKEKGWQRYWDYGNPSQNWRHPITNACYQGGKNLHTYSKNLTSLSSYL